MITRKVAWVRPAKTLPPTPAKKPTWNGSVRAGGLLFYDSRTHEVWVVLEKDRRVRSSALYTDIGGCYEETDLNIFSTIRREAWEETYGLMDFKVSEIEKFASECPPILIDSGKYKYFSIVVPTSATFDVAEFDRRRERELQAHENNDQLKIFSTLKLVKISIDKLTSANTSPRLMAIVAILKKMITAPMPRTKTLTLSPTTVNAIKEKMKMRYRPRTPPMASATPISLLSQVLSLTEKGRAFLALGKNPPSDAIGVCSLGDSEKELWREMIAAKMVVSHPEDELYHESYGLSERYFALENFLTKLQGQSAVTIESRRMHERGRALVRTWAEDLGLIA